jgi:hypothetical protein
VTLAGGQAVTLRHIDACAGEIAVCVETPDGLLVWIALDELNRQSPSGVSAERPPAQGAA